MVLVLMTCAMVLSFGEGGTYFRSRAAVQLPPGGRSGSGSAQQAEHALRHLVGLGQHGRTGLLQ
ncbi:hypothetical protein, partial [Stenotrophomonas maltophilia]|uniref:hypothetical protein n=1 Tax=Stenotrophomonas maltophilia TaxID=40324 RepID=UPI003CCFD88B